MHACTHTDNDLSPNTRTEPREKRESGRQTKGRCTLFLSHRRRQQQQQQWPTQQTPPNFLCLPHAHRYTHTAQQLPPAIRIPQPLDTLRTGRPPPTTTSPRLAVVCSCLASNYCSHTSPADPPLQSASGTMAAGSAVILMARDKKLHSHYLAGLLSLPPLLPSSVRRLLRSLRLFDCMGTDREHALSSSPARAGGKQLAGSDRRRPSSAPPLRQTDATGEPAPAGTAQAEKLLWTADERLASLLIASTH
ncbi:hypothetical protein C0Q70_19524 [Pomacea canaliculata]|uniref:Uncharacterized protein n=1 Tax=Pomacea canaliculata TaxID=400727 RepID=A0A2T7NJK9_POMCA|nr:hypothetical protein C0Q70_19524 [Pomacea canaliculata]